MSSLVDIDNLRVSFRQDDGSFTEAVRGVSLSLGREKLGIVGESGSGKSLTGRALLGVLPPYARMSVERMSFDGLDLTSATPRVRRALRGGRMGMILQDPKFSLNPVMQVGRQIVEAIRIGDRRISGAAARKRALAMLEAVQIREPERVFGLYPHELSGGMGQRVMIAMMLVREPDLLVADEPTSALDVTVRTQVLSILDELVTRRGMGLILISHDLNLVSRFCDRVLVMYAGHVVEDLQASHLHQATHPYTRGLLACLPSIDGPLTPLPTLNRDAGWAAS
ncbi:MAG: peptide ABC transporter ATP-binding protein [Devosia sp. 67-54]|uniref:ABC transporter ATP-binding protein n=1 Tax=unclassified Devosia TaxID=196773 RepID=UPI00086B31F2|nr:MULTISPECIES: ABC transporter ATP-binding protein [unclassified Devosia]MBN9305241.1 ABC transporter ATP-binding protein [Devosia sp.]ODU54970.1 MAG: peptide ABC transporter ATP-binding protein [Acetobacteraceae bacterium SCN 69-10]OJX14844.1 MAG: peptide ABC transporter ATP-binding protein [Devosia sp. 67-54]